MRAMLFLVLALAVGCGGGSGGTQMATAQLAGTVTAVDGQSADLAGVQVTLLETGQRAWSDASGAFAFRDLAPGVYTLGFDTALMALAMTDGEGGDATDGDDDGPGSDDAEDEFEDGDGHPKVDVPEGGDVEVTVAIDGGKVTDFSSDHAEGQHAMARLHLTDAAEVAGYHVEGSVRIAAAPDHTVFKVCVEGLAADDVIEVFLGEGLVSIGTAMANEEGRASVVVEDSIPLGAASLGDLAGTLVQVFLSDLKLLVGEVPALHEEHDGEHDGDADEPDQDGDDSHDGMDGHDDDGEHHDGEAHHDDPGEDDGIGDDTPDGDEPGDGTGGDGEGAV